MKFVLLPLGVLSSPVRSLVCVGCEKSKGVSCSKEVLSGTTPPESKGIGVPGPPEGMLYRLSGVDVYLGCPLEEGGVGMCWGAGVWVPRSGVPIPREAGLLVVPRAE